MPNQQLHLFQETKKANKNNFDQFGEDSRIATFNGKARSISWSQLFLKLARTLKVPFVAAQHLALTKIKAFIQIRPFPWFKTALAILLVYMLSKKDMQFDVNMGDSSNLATEQHQSNSVQTSAFSVNSLSRNSFSKKNIKNTLIPNFANEDVQTYITRFKRVSLMEMQKFGIPASVKMGQAILASHAGKNVLAQQFNNHFSTFCSQNADCEIVHIDNQQLSIKKYESAWEGWRDHSMLMAKRYASFKKYGKNYREWAIALEEAGYSSEPNYGQQLVQCIENYKLYHLDTLNEHL